MTPLLITEQHVLTFNVPEKTDIRFIIESDEFDIICKSNRVGENLVITVPKLEGILEAKQYQSKIEFINGDNIVKMSAEIIEFVDSGIKISSKLQENIERAKTKYNVKELNGFHVLMDADLYYGFVTETSMVESDIGYQTLSNLVESLSN